MNHPKTYSNQQVVVLGLAKSGVSAAKIFHGLGAKVVVNDKKSRDQSPEAAELEEMGITVLCGGHPEHLLTLDTALIVKNPGIPYTASPVQQALRQQIEVVTEVEVAYLLSPAPMIGITGSNGKTTTTTWIGELLRTAGMRPIVAGNIGRPLCEAAAEADPQDWIVAELSSFQLKGTTTFKPKVGVLLNLVETHLDYHGSMEDYIASKAKLFSNMTNEDVAVINWDDPICRALSDQIRARLLPFSMKERLPQGLYVEPPVSAMEQTAEEVKRMIVSRDSKGVVTEIVAVDELGVPGRHNAYNALAAIAACLAAGAPIERLAAPLRSFKGVEHRLEYVCRKNEINYYNDSKATNPTATTMSVQSLKGGIVLIAGGLDRGSDYMELLPVFKQRLKGLVVLGETRGKLAHVAELAGLAKVEIVEPEETAETTLRAAVQLASELAEPGDTILLSPACASWDMFASYEQRGRIFKDSAHTL